MEELKTEIALLFTDIAEAVDIFSPVWPLETFIAVNHISGLEKYAFDQAINVMSSLTGAKGYMPLDFYESAQAKGRIGEANLKMAVAEKQARLSSENKTRSGMIEYSTLADWVGKLTNSDPLSDINKEVMKWCSLYFDRGQATWQMPYKSLGLFAAWRKLATIELFPSLSPSRSGAKINLLPNNSFEAILTILSEMAVLKEERVNYLSRHFAQMPGWASHIRWAEKNSENASESHVLADYLALRLFYELEICRDILEKKSRLKPNLKEVKQLLRSSAPATLSNLRVALPIKEGNYEADLFQDAFEINYRNNLLRKIVNNNDSNKQNSEFRMPDEPEVQMVFCIDVRSEGIRRNIEALSNYQTIGFAGFFGFPVFYTPTGSTARRELCPVLLHPKYEVSHRQDKKKDGAILKWLSARLANRMLWTVMHFLRGNILAKFYFVEAAGIWCMPLAFARNFFPDIMQSLSKKALNEKVPLTTFSLELSPNDQLGIPLQDRLYFAEASLRAMGLTKHFGRIIVLTGHGSSSYNNPYASSLDCGACGGNTGAASARLAAAIFNQSEVRAGLKERGIEIPESTTFIAAEHNTTTDEIVFFDTEYLRAGQAGLLSALKDTITQAGAINRKERLAQFAADDRHKPNLRAADWSQTRPEWGLARNAAFIAAKRAVTYGLDLERRAFLHDYDEEEDANGKVLELILTAPLVVAQWINMQYYLSAVDNTVFGSGTKVTQNVVGNLGVMQGALSDLKLGLPWESVASNSDELYHEPMRLLAVIQAKRENIDTIVNCNSQLRNLVNNRWIRLVALEGKKTFESIGSNSWLELNTREVEHQYSEQLVS